PQSNSSSPVTPPSTSTPSESNPNSDPYVSELTGKAKAHQSDTPQVESSRPTESPAAVSQPSPPAPSEFDRKKADEEFRRKELERIEAEVNKAAEERKKREAAATVAPAVVSPAPAPAPAPAPTQPPVVATAPKTPAADAPP